MDQVKDDSLRGVARGVREVARKTRVALMFLREGKPFPAEMMEQAAGELLAMVRRSPEQAFYALIHLQSERQWLRQSLRVAVVLGDVMLREPRWQADAEDAVLGGLLHVMGKPLLVDVPCHHHWVLSEAQRALLRPHALTLAEQLCQHGWQVPAATLDVILNAGERLDGSGSPVGKTAEQLSPLARLAAVVSIGSEAIDPEYRSESGGTTMTPAELYRYLYLRPNAFDRSWVVRLTRHYGLYPVGTLVRFSSGALGWVMALDERGVPARVRLVHDPLRPGVRIDREVAVDELPRLGKPEDVVNPADHGVSFSRD